MPLSREIAEAIVKVVQQDPACQERIPSCLSYVLPDSWGIAGPLRNWGLVISGKDPSNRAVAGLVCT
jgi:hypothetical protein